jgi:hypothetical protein
MTSKTALAVLGMSAVVPLSAGAEPLASPAPPQAGTRGSITIGPNESLAGKPGVTVTATEYQFNLPVTVAMGHAAYGFRAAVATAAGESVTPILHLAIGDAETGGQWASPMACIGKRGATNINWAPTSATTIMSVHVNREAFDAARARLRSTITVSGYLQPTTDCPPPSYSDDDDK